jgi:hypothetical protein
MKMYKWRVIINPYDYVVDYVTCLDPPPTGEKYLVTTLSGAITIEVEATTEEEAKVLAVKHIMLKRIKDLEALNKDSYESYEANRKRLNANLDLLNRTIDSFRDILTKGEIKLFDTGRAIYVTWWHPEGGELKFEIPSAIHFSNLMEEIMKKGNEWDYSLGDPS